MQLKQMKNRPMITIGGWWNSSHQKIQSSCSSLQLEGKKGRGWLSTYLFICYFWLNMKKKNVLLLSQILVLDHCWVVLSPQTYNFMFRNHRLPNHPFHLSKPCLCPLALSTAVQKQRTTRIWREERIEIRNIFKKEYQKNGFTRHKKEQRLIRRKSIT